MIKIKNHIDWKTKENHLRADVGHWIKRMPRTYQWAIIYYLYYKTLLSLLNMDDYGSPQFPFLYLNFHDFFGKTLKWFLVTFFMVMNLEQNILSKNDYNWRLKRPIYPATEPIAGGSSDEFITIPIIRAKVNAKHKAKI